MNFREKLETPALKKLLACDGRGVRGIVSIEILAHIEVELRKLTNNPQLVLADYFDYVAGSSVGAIIATLVALGLSVDQIRQFFAESASEMFQKPDLGKITHQVPGRPSFGCAPGNHRRRHNHRFRLAADTADDRFAQCHDQFTLAAFQ
jgi:predicted acylesterase/phospholipase RssA